MSGAEVREIVQLVFNMELLAISIMGEVLTKYKVSFGPPEDLKGVLSKK